MKKIYCVIITIALLGTSACDHIGSSNGSEKSGIIIPEYPVDNTDRRALKRGKIMGDVNLLDVARNGGTSSGGIFGNKKGSALWNSTLDTLSFMPLASADRTSGLIITDWYEDVDAKGERFKINARVKEDVKISVFKQQLRNRYWRDVAVSSDVARKLEDEIRRRVAR